MTELCYRVKIKGKEALMSQINLKQHVERGELCLDLTCGTHSICSLLVCCLQFYWCIYTYIHTYTFNIHVESQRFSSLGEKNKQSALQWRSLTEEEREKYCSEAAAHNCGDAIVNSKKEADKIIRHLVDTVRQWIWNRNQTYVYAIFHIYALAIHSYAICIMQACGEFLPHTCSYLDVNKAIIYDCIHKCNTV